MSTFHKTSFTAYKIKNALIAQQAEKEVLEQILHHLRKMSTEAILLEQLVLAKLPKFSLKTECNEQVFLTTFIIALQGIIERELKLREIYEHDLFSDEN